MKIIKQIDNLTESNIYIIIEENYNKAIVIDIGNYDKTKEIIIQNNIIVEKLILTHEHYDHIAGLNQLRKDYNFEVIASSKCNKGIQDCILNKSRNFGVYLYFLGKEYKNKVGEYVCKEANIVFDEN